MIAEKDPVAKETYNECVGSCFDRYYAASQKSWAAQWKEMKPEINTAFSGINKAALEMRKVALSDMGKSLVNFSVSISNMIKPIIDMQEVINSYSKQINETISKTIGNLSQVVGSLATKINIPTYTEEDRQRIKDSHVKWGEYGWSIIPEAPLKFYFTVPENRIEANQLALKYCGDSAMENLFSEMKDVAGVKKSDFEDAVFCFRNKKYKPCAMILFSLLDAKLIRMQKD